MVAKTRTFSAIALHRETPVPSDLDIVQEAVLKPIGVVAAELGFQEDEFE